MDSATSGVQSYICGHQATRCEHLNKDDIHTRDGVVSRNPRGVAKGSMAMIEPCSEQMDGQDEDRAPVSSVFTVLFGCVNFWEGKDMVALLVLSPSLLLGLNFECPAPRPIC